jgi:ABC-type transport system substrate-binding protein
MPGHTPNIGWPYDPKRARALLAEAGFPGGRGFPETELFVWRGREQLGQAPLSQWRENLGVPLTLNASLDWEGFLSMLDQEPPSMWLGVWITDYSDPDNVLRAGLRRWTRSSWQHEGFIQKVEKARRLTDQKQRMVLYRAADRIAIEQASVLPLVHLRLHLLVRSWVRGIGAWSGGYGFWQDVVIESH